MLRMLRVSTHCNKKKKKKKKEDYEWNVFYCASSGPTVNLHGIRRVETIGHRDIISST